VNPRSRLGNSLLDLPRPRVLDRARAPLVGTNWVAQPSFGPDALLFTVSHGSPTSSTLADPVTVTPVDDAPVLAAVADQAMDKLAPMARTPTATDMDLPANLLAFGLVSGQAGLMVVASGQVGWMPTGAPGPSSSTVLLKVTDNGTPSRSTTNQFMVVVREVNRAPRFATVPSLRATSSRPFSDALAGVDEDLQAQTLVFPLVSDPANRTISPREGVRWTPCAQQSGRAHSVRVSLNDRD
jgi:large repetitive protein